MRRNLWLGILTTVYSNLYKRWLTVFLLTALAGCSKSVKQSIDAAAEARQQAQVEQKAMQKAEDTARQQIEQIPPPAKSRYLAVHTQESWANPFLVVGRETVHMKIMLPDANPGAYGTGTMLRPVEARRQELDLRLTDLPNALSAVPTGSWPYGRVVAVEETPVSAKADRPQIRRNVEATIQMLNDLGVVVDEWTGPNGSLLR
jgi:hypothetical protein